MSWTRVQNYLGPLGLIMGAGGALAAAFFLQYVLNVPPCIFCIYERYPLGATAVLAIVGMFLESRGRFWIFLICGLLMLLETGITLYHVAIEHHFVALPARCGGWSERVDFHTLKTFLMNRPIVRCDLVAFKILGRSLAELGVILASVLSVWSFYFARQEKKITKKRAAIHLESE